MIIIGVDSGKSGGIVVLDEKYKIRLKTPMPLVKSAKNKDEYDLPKIRDMFEGISPDFVMLEKSMLVPMNGKMAFKDAGFCTGIFQMLCICQRLKYDLVMPQVWQREIFQSTQKQDTKQAAFMFCQRTFPDEIWTVGNSKKFNTGLTDAACIAVYALRRGV